jgi:RNA polymerase sigma-70 factor (ECF subfamily)
LETFNSVYNVGVTVDLGDATGFRQAFADHHRAVYSAAFRVLGDAALAQDVVQDVFLRLWRKPSAFDASRGELGTYLRLMARSRALDLWREGQVRGRAADRLKVVCDTPSTDPADLDHDGDEVRAALSQLPATQREALVLAYWGGLTAAQIAQRANVPLGTAKSRLRLGLARLREDFGDPGERATPAASVA